MARPPESDERRLPWIAALLRHVHTHRRPHRPVLVGDRHRPAAFFREQYETVRARWPDLTGRRVVHEMIRAMINRQATDLLDTSRAAIDAACPGSVDDVRGHRTALICFSAHMLEQNRELKQLLRKELYRRFRVFRMSMKAQRIVKDLFAMPTPAPRSHEAMEPMPTPAPQTREAAGPEPEPAPEERDFEERLSARVAAWLERVRELLRQ